MNLQSAPHRRLRDRKDLIFDAARDLFSRGGYHATTMRELARVVDLESGSLYSHIDSKEELLWGIVSRAVDEFSTRAALVAQELPPEEKLRQMVRGHLEVTVEQLPSARVFFHEWEALSPGLRERVRERRDAYQALFRGVIEEGMRQGAFRVEDTRLATTFVLSTLNWTYQWFDPDGRLSVDEIADRYTTLILNGLGGKGG